MRISNRHWNQAVPALLLAGLLAAAGCGGGKEEQGAAGTGDTSTSSAKPVADAPYRDVLEAAGYQPVFYESFPSQIAGMKSDVVVYHARSGSGGGVLYLQEFGSGYQPLWHWYFEKDAPDSVQALEINEDGLWDVRMFVDGEPVDYVQDQSFTFVTRRRDDRIAMNGDASEPIDAESMAWHAFDSDTTTAWQSALDDAFIEIPVPLGIEKGILTIQLLADHQPDKVELSADGKKVQEFELEETTLEQAIQLDPAAMKAKVLRLDFDSAHRGSDTVAVAELGVK